MLKEESSFFFFKFCFFFSDVVGILVVVWTCCPGHANVTQSEGSPQSGPASPATVMELLHCAQVAAGWEPSGRAAGGLLWGSKGWTRSLAREEPAQRWAVRAGSASRDLPAVGSCLCVLQVSLRRRCAGWELAGAVRGKALSCGRPGTSRLSACSGLGCPFPLLRGGAELAAGGVGRSGSAVVTAALLWEAFFCSDCGDMLIWLTYCKFAKRLRFHYFSVLIITLVIRQCLDFNT